RKVPLSPLGPLDEFGFGDPSPSHSFVCRCGKRKAFFESHAAKVDSSRFATVRSRGITTLREVFSNGGLADTKVVGYSGFGHSLFVHGDNLGNGEVEPVGARLGIAPRTNIGEADASLFGSVLKGGSGDTGDASDLILRMSDLIKFDRLVKIDRDSFRGHVYNLQTEEGWFAYNNIITHNCTHSVSAYLPSVTERPKRAQLANPEGYEIRQRQRYMERQIRRWKRREAAAITDEEREFARRKVRAWQAEIR